MLMAKLPPRKPQELPPCEPTQAVISAIVDCGQHEDHDLKGNVIIKPMVMWLVELASLRSDGKRFVLNNKLNNSAHKKSNQSKFIGAIRGKAVTEEEAQSGIPLDPFVGTNILVTPVINNGWANIGQVMKCPSSMTPIVPLMKELPFWVHSYIAKAKIKPEGYVAPEKRDQDGEELPF